jgi:hypothetical protein
LNKKLLLIKKDDYYSLEAKKFLKEVEEIKKGKSSTQTWDKHFEEAFLARIWATSFVSLQQWLHLQTEKQEIFCLIASIKCSILSRKNSGLHKPLMTCRESLSLLMLIKLISQQNLRVNRAAIASAHKLNLGVRGNINICMVESGIVINNVYIMLNKFPQGCLYDHHDFWMVTELDRPPPATLLKKKKKKR